jgi:hypothetical protein
VLDGVCVSCGFVVFVYDFPNRWAHQKCLTFYSTWRIVRFHHRIFLQR